MDDVIVIIVSVTFTSAIWGVLIKLFGQGYLDKLNRDWKTKQERDISELQSSLKREENFSSNLLQIYKSSNDEIQKKRILAASELWDLTMDLKCTSLPLMMVNSTYLDSEIRDPKNKADIEKILKLLPKEEEFYNKLKISSEKGNRLRLFVTDEAWGIYHVYLAFMIRQMFEIYNVLRENKDFPIWKQNEGTKTYLELAFDPEDLESIYQNPDPTMNEVVIAYLEERLKIEINKIFSGEFTLRNQKEVFEKISKETQRVTLKDVLQTHEFQVLKSWGI
jgi:uncharacterized protein YfkK (UPF0435 family)